MHQVRPSYYDDDENDTVLSILGVHLWDIILLGLILSLDYAEMQSRDPEDRPDNCAVGVGRSIMANRLSYFLNVHGPSVTIDTACSGSLVGLDIACRTIQSGEADAAIIASSNLYLHPDHVIDRGSVGQTHSASAICQTFDEKADGYVKSEAVSCVIIKRLTDAIMDRNPIRAIIRGTATNRYVYLHSGPFDTPFTLRKHLTGFG